MTEQLDFDDDYAPRYGATPTPMGRLAERLEQILRAIYELQRGSQLRNASISGGEGLRILDDDGTIQAQIKPDRTVTIFDQSGAPVVRMGQMLNTGPQSYGIEVRIGASWIQLGSQNVSWGNVGAKPQWGYNDSVIGGSYISGNVAGANWANGAAQADGSSRAWNNNVGGNSFYAVWVGNDGNFNLGRNTSSIKYKKNFRPVEADPLRVLNIEEVIFDRIDYEEQVGNGGIGPKRMRPGAKDEYGTIAEQVAKHMPELIQYFEGEIDGVRYDLIGLALIPVVRMHEGRLDAIEKRLAEQDARQDALERRIIGLEQRANGGSVPPQAGTTKGTIG